MARTFTASSTDVLISANNIGITGSTNRSCFIWAIRNADSINANFMEWGDGTAARWTFRNQSTADTMRVEIDSDGDTTALGVDKDVWSLYGAILNGTDLDDVFVKRNAGGSEALQGTVTINTSATSILIGNKVDGARPWQGQLAYCFITTEIIIQKPIQALARGANPFGFGYVWTILAPIYGNDSTEPEWANQNNFTLTGTSKFKGNPPRITPVENYI